MKKQVWVILLLVVVAAGCRSKAAFNYSESIVKKEKSLVNDINATQTRLTRYMEYKQYDSVAEAGQVMEAIVQEKISEIDAMELPDAKGAAEFKAAALDYFRYIKSLYTGYKNLGMAQTEEQRDRVIRDLQDTEGEMTNVLTKMQQAQQRYANANGFKVETK